MQKLSKRTFFLPLFLIVTTGAWADTTVKRLAPGVTLTQEIDQKTPLIINVVTVDLTAPGVRIGVGIGQDKISGLNGKAGREDVSRIARRWGAIAAINADFFPYTGDPLGVGIRDGELFSEPFLGIRQGGPRVTLGIAPDGKSVLFDNLSFLGDLQAGDGNRTFINGINRSVGKNEIVVFSSLYGPVTANKPGGVEAVVTGVNLPVRANKLLTGHVQSVRVVETDTEAISDDGVVISAGPGSGADFLAAHLHPNDPISFVLAIAPVGETGSAFQVATLPRTGRDLPSRAGEGISRSAWVWAQVPQAVGGGPRLLVDGQVAIDWGAEGFDAGFPGSLNPRTAVGTTQDGHHLLLVTVDGREAVSKGVTLADMALILKRYGAWSAINLDGGGSTTMAVDGLTVSNPEGEGSERPVADMIMVYSDRAYQSVAPALPAATATTQSVKLLVPTAPIFAGSAVPLKLQEGDRVLPGSSESIVWQGPASGGIGFVNQKGYFIATIPGSGTLTALYRGQMLTTTVSVVGRPQSAALFTLQGRFVSDPQGVPDHNQLVIRITDSNGKPLAGASVQVSVNGGTADKGTLQTDFDGNASVGIIWIADQGGSATITSAALTPILIKQP